VKPQVHANLFAAAAFCLGTRDPGEKAELTLATAAAWRAGSLGLEEAGPVAPIGAPGRPDRPELVPPRDLPRRSPRSLKGRAALVHAVTHIEFNAINLAWDAVYRFRGLPRAWYDDWVQVAAEEAEHFTLMRGRLKALGFDYGDFPAHDGLWGLAVATAADPLLRMALAPRVMEARGLDVTPAMIERLCAAGDAETADCLRVILREEVGHVAAGNRWFRHLCGERGLDPEATWFDLIARHLRGEVRCPLNLPDRRLAGFEEAELERLQTLCEGALGSGREAFVRK
jgi:uncharacterized ferritin-like protein (DUF455 family)